MQLTTIRTEQGTHGDTREALAVSNMGRLSKSVTHGYSRDKHLLLTAPPQVAINAGGTPVGPDATPRQAFAAAGADFQVVTRPIAFDLSPEDEPNSAWRGIGTHKAVIRTDTNQPLGVVGKGYQPIPNEALITLFEFLREDASLDNIVTIHGGRRVYATATIAIEGEVIPGDIIRRHLHAFNSFDGTSSFGVFFSDMRLVCSNQLAYISGRGARKAKADGHGLVMKHTKSVLEFAQNLPRLINLQNQSFARSLEELKPLTTTRLSTEAARAVLEATFADKLALPITDKETGKKRPRVLADLDTEVGLIRSHAFGDTGIGINTADRSVWNLFQAITQYETHDQGKLKDATESARARLESLWGGQASKRIDRAREACLALV